MLQRAAARWGSAVPRQLNQAWHQQQQQWQQRCLIASASEGGSGASSGSSSASTSTSSQAAAASASSNAASTSSGPKSMLDSSFVHPGAAGQVLGTAAEARMHRLQQEAAEAASAAAAASGAGQAAGAAAGGAAGAAASGARRVFGLLGDVLMVGAIGAVATGGYLYTAYDIKDLQKMAEESEEKQEEEQSLPQKAWMAAVRQYVQLAAPLQRKVREYTDPSCDKLLPDMAPEHRGRIKTLVLDLDDLLVHKEWSRARGWQVYKRPGAADFIYQMGQYYEIVIYTDETNMYADPIINRLDPYRVIPYRLYRQDTQYVNGKHVRDLSKLNRDPSQVMFLSANPDAYAFQPQNTLKLQAWNNDPKDTTLLDLIPFLQMVATKGVPDVRDVVRSYDGEEDVARAFKERMAHLTDGKKGTGGGEGAGGGGGRRGRGLFSGGLATQ